MKVNSHKQDSSLFPDELAEIADPPKQLNWYGRDPLEFLKLPRVGIVGSRRPTAYGHEVTYRFSSQLAAKGIVIVSGLAFGVDSIAHKAALEAGGLTIAVLPGGLDNIYPASHRDLAQKIVDSGGSLISEYESGQEIRKNNFIARNRIISALSEVLLVTQAAKNSGSIHTANFALEQGRSVMATPGAINEPMSEGCNNLIKGGALMATSADDVFFALGFSLKKQISSSGLFQASEEERLIYDLIAQGISSQDQLIAECTLSSDKFHHALTMLELSGHIRSLGGGNWIVS